MSLQKNINKYWDYLEEKYPSPKYVGKIKYMEFDDLKKAIDDKNENYIKKNNKKYVYKKRSIHFKKCSNKKT